ncbi:hypothetical protein [Chitinimonas sp.]|uniref:hypothetical protein n=1 Tax=Chitinimonas sp. TaxID=1934313 RepID=UPI0035B2C785
MSVFPITAWLPAGASGLDALAGLPGWHPLVWRRWLSWRSEDAQLEQCLALIEAAQAGQLPNDWANRLSQSLAGWRCRYVLFLAWSGGVGGPVRAEAELPSLQGLPGNLAEDFGQWRRQQLADCAALQANQAWQAHTPFADALRFRQVAMAQAFDYYLLPKLLSDRLQAFQEPLHG